MTDSQPRVITGFMVGAFLALGVDTLVVVAALWYVGRLSGARAGLISTVVLVFFALWLVSRWVRLRLLHRAGRDDDTSDTAERDPLERLKQRYANGDLSETEFEARLDALLDADRRAESRTDTATRRRERAYDSESSVDD